VCSISIFVCHVRTGVRCILTYADLISTLEAVIDTLRFVIEKDHISHDHTTRHYASISKTIISKFRRLLFCLFCLQIIGSSLLIVSDERHVGVWMIDFAKILYVPDRLLSHRDPWQLGNHEDGYLVGIDNLIKVTDCHQFPFIVVVTILKIFLRFFSFYLFRYIYFILFIYSPNSGSKRATE